jgi:hypothetical protein
MSSLQTKLEKRAEQVLLGSKGCGGGDGGGRKQGAEMTQIMYAHMNNEKIKKGISKVA